jgi:hypothetical protein
LRPLINCGDRHAVRPGIKRGPRNAKRPVPIRIGLNRHTDQAILPDSVPDSPEIPYKIIQMYDCTGNLHIDIVA